MIEIDNDALWEWMVQNGADEDEFELVGARNLEDAWNDCQEGWWLLWLISHTRLAGDSRCRTLAVSLAFGTPVKGGTYLETRLSGYREALLEAKAALYCITSGEWTTEMAEEALYNAYIRAYNPYADHCDFPAAFVAMLIVDAAYNPNPAGVVLELANRVANEPVLWKSDSRQAIALSKRAKAWQADLIRKAFFPEEVARALMESINTNAPVPLCYNDPMAYWHKLLARLEKENKKASVLRSLTSGLNNQLN